jgi:hypothetical protein
VAVASSRTKPIEQHQVSSEVTSSSSSVVESRNIQQDYYTFPKQQQHQTSHFSSIKVTVTKDESRVVSPMKMSASISTLVKEEEASRSETERPDQNGSNSASSKKSKRSVHIKAELIAVKPNKSSLVQQLSNISRNSKNPLIESQISKDSSCSVNSSDKIIDSESHHTHQNSISSSEVSALGDDFLDIMVNEKDNLI